MTRAGSTESALSLAAEESADILPLLRFARRLALHRTASSSASLADSEAACAGTLRRIDAATATDFTLRQTTNADADRGR
jgi:hypothetical protein